MKKFFGSTFMKKSSLEKEGIYHPIELEYYKNIDENEKIKYGISVVKKEYKKDETKIETKHIKNLSQDEEKIEKLLSIFKKFEVTPVAVEYIIEDMKN